MDCLTLLSVITLTLMSGAMFPIYTDASSCPVGWIASDSSCYLALSSTHSRFSNILEARDMCRQHNGDLAALSSEQEQLSLYWYLRSFNNTKETYVYIGLTDINHPGTFYWINNQSVTYNNLTAAEAGRHFIGSSDSRCSALQSPAGDWSNEQVTWSVVPCCFPHQHDVSMVLCQQPQNFTGNVTEGPGGGKDMLQDYCHGDCPAGWHKFGSTCYTVQEGAGLGASDVRQQCLKQGADVISISDPVAAAVTSYIVNEAFLYDTTNTAEVTFYIGVNDIVTEGSYVQSDGSAVTYTMWGAGEPNNAMLGGGQTENCVGATWLIGGQYLNSTWSDVACCSSNYTYYGCSKPVNETIVISPDRDVIMASCNASSCSSLPCLHNGTCTDELFGYNCTCAAGYTGRNCETDINECLAAPCQNNATCIDEVAAYNCTCVPGFTGVHCEIDINECLSLPCQNGSTCTDRLNGYSCSCLNGFTGVNCETIIDYCPSSNCSNGATCRPKLNGFDCQCGAAYTGLYCETLFDYCYGGPCKLNGTCHNGASNYTCFCLPGTTGLHCETDIDDCANKTCQHGGSCIDQLNSAYCSCPAAYTGALCETSIACGAPPTPENCTQVGNYTGDQPGFGTTLTYQCMDGFKFVDMSTRKVIICQNTGVWNETLTGCAASCDAVPMVPNAQAYSYSFVIGNTINFTCNTGFILSTNETSINSTCQQDRTWSVDLTNITCELRRCPELPVYPYQTLDSFNNTYNTTITFWCDVGYVLFDNTTARTIKCLADGTWTADLPPCDPVKCPRLLTQAHTTRNTSANTYMTYTKYQCDNGYRMLDGADYRIILCDAGAEWSDEITNCTSTRCFPLPYVANATPSTTVADYWTQSVLTCIKGHKFNIDGVKYDKRSMTCQNNGWWSPILTSCDPVLCPSIPTGERMQPSTTNQLYGTVVTYRCEKGNVVYTGNTPWFSEMTIECLENAQWNNTVIPSCYPYTCPPPMPITNGTKVDPPNNNYTQLIQYTCNTGNKFLDGRVQKNVMCNEFGQWNESDVTCRSDRCSPINITSNTLPDTTNTSWYVNVTYRCKTGYEWPNNRTVKVLFCQPGGTWNDTFDMEKDDCTIKRCPPVPVMQNATTNSTDDVYGSEVTYECNVGHKYADGSTAKVRSCSSDATWEPAVFPPCEIIHCPALPEVENATKDSNETYYNLTVAYSSWPGYQFKDKTKVKYVTCTENGTWTALPSGCEVIFCPPLPIWTSTTFNSTDNNFYSTVSYSCQDGYAFADYKAKPGNQTTLTSTCQVDKKWYPSIQDCIALSKINADLIGKSWESPQSVPIGTVACSIMCLLLFLVVLLDLKKLYNDFKMFRSNTRDMCCRNNNKVTPRNDNDNK